MKKLFLLLAALWAVPAFAQFSISQLPPATVPLTGAELFPCTQAGTTKKCLTSSVPAAANATFILQSANASLPLSRTLVGTANEILLADGGPLGNLVLSTPQPIAATSSPTFSGLTLTSLTGILVGNNVSALTVYAGASCTNQFVRALSSTGTATCNTVANTDLANSSITLNGAAIALGGTRTLSLASADFVNQGTTTTLLHGNAAGNPSFSAVANADMVNSSVTLNGASLALGGTRTLSLASADFVNQGTTTTVLHGNAAGNPSFGSVTSSDLAAGVFANPSGLITLSAANGVATTATRSDATHALDQSISPTWTGTHLFRGGVSRGGTTSQVTVGSISSLPLVGLTNSTAGTDKKSVEWVMPNANGDVTLQNINEAANVTSPIFSSVRGTATAVASIALGNTTDKPAITLNGPVTVPAPTSGDTVTLAGLSGGRALFANYATGTGPSSVVFQTSVPNASASIWRLTQSAIANFDLSMAATSGVVSLINGGVTTQTISLAGAIGLPALASTSTAQTGTVCWSSTGGNLTVDTTVACLASARRFKQDIRGLDLGLWDLLKLRPVTYSLRPEVNAFHLGPQIGLIAEEVGAVDSRLISKTPDGTQALGVRYMQLTALLVKAIQQQQLEIYALWAALIGSFAFTYFRTRRRG